MCSAQITQCERSRRWLLSKVRGKQPAQHYFATFGLTHICRLGHIAVIARASLISLYHQLATFPQELTARHERGKKSGPSTLEVREPVEKPCYIFICTLYPGLYGGVPPHNTGGNVLKRIGTKWSHEHFRAVTDDLILASAHD